VNINLTPELEEFVQRKVRSGLYNNQSEVVREALRLLAQHDEVRLAHLERLRAGVAEGIAQADAGQLLDGRKVIEELRDALRVRIDSPSKG
jgi:antitoxin ParD1/3/4